MHLGEHDHMGHELIVVLIRTVILYLLALIVMRLAGKRTLGKMDTFDFVVVVSIGSAVAIGMETDNKVLPSALPIILLGVLQLALALLSRRSPWAENVTRGQSVPLIHQGTIDASAMARERVTYGDLRMELRQKGYDKIADVQEAILEPTGKVSVLPVSDAAPLTRADLPAIAKAVAEALARQGHKPDSEKQGG